jgi:hypothetical protein
VTPTVRFPSEEALRVALMSALVAEEISQSPARGWRDAEGAVWVVPAAPVKAKTLAAWKNLGLSVTDARPPEGARQARCWAELVPLERQAGWQRGDAGNGQVLFLVPDTASILEIAGELLRLGCDRQELRQTGEWSLLRVLGPPYYTLVRALDRVGGLRAFVPCGAEGVCVEAGYTHPLAKLLRPEPGHLLLLSPDRPWMSLPAGPWTDLYKVLDLAVPGRATSLAESRALPRLTVHLRLVRGAHGDAPALWVLRDDAVAKMERLLASLPEESATSFLYAVAESSETPPVVIVRARPGVRKGVTLDLDAESYRPHPQLPGLFLPCGTSLEPPLRRDKVRELLASDPNQIVWVTGDAEGLGVERIEEVAFRPLPDWVSYVIDRGATELAAWVRGASFDFSAFEVIEAIPVAEAPALEPESEEEAPRERSRTRTKAPPVTPVASKARERAKQEAPVTTAVHVDESAAAQELAAREKEFLALGTRVDDPARAVLWLAMARLNAQLSRAKDATLCWTRALWDAEDDDARRIAGAWVTAETGTGPDAARHLQSASPRREDVSAVAAIVTLEALSPGGRLEPGRVALWLDRHDDVLDLRSLWLARASLSRLVGKDALGLARARDRVLSKLHRGLSVERDVPTFLRFLGGARDPAQIERLGSHLEALARRYEKTRRASSTVEADPKLTLAYVLFVVGYGCARVGQTDRARAHAARAAALLDRAEPIHGFLARAYEARIEQAVEGLPPETPLSPEIATRLNALDKFSRYKVDRVRQFSQVLEPHERLDPVVAFQRGEQDPRGAEFTELRGMSNVAALEEAVEQIFAKARQGGPDDRARLFDGVMDFFPTIGGERAVRYLEEILGSLYGIAPPRQAQLLEEALMLAGHVGDQELGRRIYTPLRTVIAGLGEDSAAELAPVMGGMMRTLRRVGLRDEASELVLTMQKAASGTGTPARIARLHGAAALAYLGRFDQARPVFEDALTVLAGDLPVPACLELTRALARAVSHAPLEYALSALERLADKLPVITDSFNTNSHVCLSVVSFMESLVLGYASDDLTIGDLGRQWLDDDEYLIRRRVHRDMVQGA